MNKITLKAEKREETGRKLKRLRLSGLIPGNVYGKGVDSTSIKFDAKGFKKVFEEAGETGVIYLDIDGDIRPTLISNVQIGALDGSFLHVDLRQVNLNEKIEASVPVVLVGESPAEKGSIGTVVQQLNEVLVEALPTELPENFEVDTSILTEVDQAIYVRDLKVSSGVEIKSDAEMIIAKVEPPQKEEVVEIKPVEGEASTQGAFATTESTETPVSTN